MSVNLAQARDTIQIYGSLWMVMASGAVLGKLAGKPVPNAIFIPITVGGIFLANLVDLAYGNKMTRVVKEAEYILEHERGRFVPMKQAMFFHLYSDEERSVYGDVSNVGAYFPSMFPFHRPSVIHKQSPVIAPLESKSKE